MKKLILTIVLCCVCGMSNSQTKVQVGDLYYKLSGINATVTYNRSDNYLWNGYNRYYQSLYSQQEYASPESISYNGNDFNVTQVGEGAFAAWYVPGTSFMYSDYGYANGIVAGAYENTSIKKISLPNSVESIEIAAFYGLHGLNSIYMPNIITLGDYALSHCINLSQVVFPKVEVIGDNAFSNCTNLVSLSIPESVTTMGENVFAGCSLLRELFYFPVTPPTNWTATTKTYVPDIQAYSSPKYRINSAQIIEMISFADKSFVYTGQVPTTTWTNNVDGYSVSLDMPTLKAEAGEHIEIIPATFTKGEESFTANVVYRYTITPAILTVKAANKSREYGEDNPMFTFSYSGFVNGENESALETLPITTTSATKTSDVGEYPITVSGGKAANYVLEYEPGTLTLTKAPLSAKVNDVTRLYGAGNPAFTVSYNGLKNGEAVPKWSESLKIETTATAQSDVGTYTILASGKPVNYDLSQITPGTLTIAPAPLTIKANDASRFYFEPNPEFGCSYSGFVNNDDKQVITKTPVFNTDANQTSNVGNYEIVPSGAYAKNYDISYESGVLAINKLLLTATANSVSREYGEDNPALTISYEGFVNNEDESVLSGQPNITTSATKYSNVGTYDINLTGGASTNYSLTLNPGVLTVNKAPLAVIVNDATREYGDENPSFTLHYEGLKLNETEPKLEKQISIATSASANSPVGEYAINASDGTATNYLLNYNAGKLSITPATLTVTALSKFRKYGEDNPVFDYSTSSTKLNTDKFTTLPTLTCTATQASPIGTYDIVASGAVMPNYEIDYVDGTLTVGKGKLVISAKSYSRLYGEDIPTYDIVYSGFANNESEEVLTVKPTITCSATKSSNAGQYPILVSGGEANNYELSYNDGMLTIGKCRLSISTKDYSRRYGEENPEFEISYQGFVDGENESNLLKKPDITCEANSLTNVGEYPIIISGAESDNYSFIYNNGKLIITIAEQEIVWEQDFGSESFQIGDQVELRAYATSGLPIYYELSDNNIASLYSANGKAYLDCLQEGTLVIRAKQDGNNNYYTAVRKSKTLKIGDASGIETISVDALSSNAPVYDLMGNRVKLLIKGRIYIQNGKKFAAR